MNNPPPSRGRWARTNGRPSSIAGAEPMTGGGVGHFREASDQTTIKNKLSAFSQRPVTAYRNEPPVLMLDDKSRAAVEQGRQQRGTGNQHSTNARPATSYDPRRGGGGQLNVGGGGWRHLSSSNNAVSADSKHRHGMGSWRVPKPTRADVDADPPKSSRTQLKPTQDLVPQTRRSWGRLKPPSTDPLEEYGLPSKGETRLNNPKAQEAFYNVIVERYMKFCAAHSDTGDSLAEQFESLSLAGSAQRRPLISAEAAAVLAERGIGSASTSSQPKTTATATTVTTTTSTAPLHVAPPSATKPSRDLEATFLAMRKLRESISATRRTDDFAQRVHVFIARAGLLCSVAETYLPSLLALLTTVHPVSPLPNPELHEFTTYLILDRACRLGDFGAAHRIRILTPGYDDARVETVVNAVARRDWVSFWRMWRLVDGYQRGVMSWAVEGLRLHALKCLARSYFSVDRAYLEHVAGEDWDRLKHFGLGWELERTGPSSEKVVIRRPKSRP